MKHLFKALFLLLAIIVPMTATSHDFEVDGIYYNINGDEVTVTYKGNSSYNANSYCGDVTIPATVTYNGTTYSVTSIGGDAFYNCRALTSVTIPNSVTSIGYHAFCSCSGLTSVTIPNSVTSIGEWAFEDCSGLTNITIPNSVTTISDGAFSGCSGLTSVIIPNSVTEIGYRVFSGCSGLTSVIIPNSVTSIGEEAFLSCSGLTSVIIPNSVNAIYCDAFCGCSGIKSLTIGKSVTHLSMRAFHGCVSIDTLYYNAVECTFYALEDWVESVVWTESAPFYSANISSIYIGDCVPVIPNGFAKGMTNLTSINIPNSVTSIGESAFSGCSGLTSIDIPYSVTSIGNWAFSGCSGLTSIGVANNNPTYDSRNNSNAIIETASNTLIVGCQNTVIPNTITSISEEAFFACSGLTNITIPNSVTSIGVGAFTGTNLTSITCLGEEPPLPFVSLGEYDDAGCFDSNTYQNATLSVPYSAIETYKKADGWRHFLHVVGLFGINYYDFEVDSIRYKVYSENTVQVVSYVTNSLGADVSTNIVIPSNVSCEGVSYTVTAIADSAFYGNQCLHEITLPETITSIGVAAFKNCPNFKFLECLGMTPPSTNNCFDDHVQRIPLEGLGIDDWYDYEYEGSNPDFWLVLFVNADAYTNYKAEFQNTEYFSYITTHEVTSAPDYDTETIYANDTHDWFVTGAFAGYGEKDRDYQNRAFGLIKSIHFSFYPSEESTLYSRSTYEQGGYSYTTYDVDGYVSPYSYCKPATYSGMLFAVADGKLPSSIVHFGCSFSPLYGHYYNESGIFFRASNNSTAQVTFGGLYSLCGGEKGMPGESEYDDSYDDSNLVEVFYYSGDIVIPSSIHGHSVTSIGYNAFKDCENLTSVTLPATIESIDDIDYPYDDGPVCFSNCPNLTRITCLGTVPPNASSINFDDGVYQNTKLYVPFSAIEAYRCAPGWCNFQNIASFYDFNFELDGVYYRITSDNEVVVARSEEAYQGVVIVPSSVTHDGVTYTVTGIGYDAFANADLSHLVLPVSISTIDPTAFTNSHVGALVITGNGAWTAGPIAADVDQLFVMSGVTGVQGLQVNPTTIYSYSTVPPTCNGQTFMGYDGELHVPASSLAAYFTAPYWNYFINIIGDAVEPTGITLSKDSVDLLVGNQLTLAVAPAPANATPNTIIWTSSNEQIATVSNGEIAAVGVGECVIKAILLDKIATCHVTVTEIAPTELTLNQEFAKLEVGSQLTLTATILPEDATDKTVTWTTSNSAVATVDDMGTVTAVGPGECNITATCRDMQATCHVIVVEHLIYISLDQHEANLLPNHILLLTPSVSPVSTDLVVTSSNPAVAAARMANGKIQVVGITEGVTTITVNSTDGYAEGDSCVVTVYTERGDLNMDGYVNMDDLTRLINYLVFNDATGISLTNADVNSSGSVNMDDLTSMINYLVFGQWPSMNFTVNGVSFSMIPVEGGTFTMGANDDDAEAYDLEKPAHQVTVSPYCIGQTLVTQALWQAVMGSNPSYFTPANGYSQDLQRPVEQISWDDCLEFIAKLNQMTGKQFRFPTEAEWEYAARGGNKSQGYKYSGSNSIDDVCWYDENSYALGTSSPDYGTHAVATKSPNELGLYDMSGNVWEWCQDWYGSYSVVPQTNPTGPSSGSFHVFRGGSWISGAIACRISHRFSNPSIINGNFGLRLAL